MQIQRFSLYKQIELFQRTQAFMRDKIGKAAADKLLGEAYYVVAMGTNDLINNYLLPVLERRQLRQLHGHHPESPAHAPP